MLLIRSSHHSGMSFDTEVAAGHSGAPRQFLVQVWCMGYPRGSGKEVTADDLVPVFSHSDGLANNLHVNATT
jgi:hypothetical protein